MNLVVSTKVKNASLIQVLKAVNVLCYITMGSYWQCLLVLKSVFKPNFSVCTQD